VEQALLSEQTCYLKKRCLKRVQPRRGVASTYRDTALCSSASEWRVFRGVARQPARLHHEVARLHHLAAALAAVFSLGGVGELLGDPKGALGASLIGHP